MGINVWRASEISPPKRQLRNCIQIQSRAARTSIAGIFPHLHPEPLEANRDYLIDVTAPESSENRLCMRVRDPSKRSQPTCLPRTRMVKILSWFTSYLKPLLRSPPPNPNPVLWPCSSPFATSWVSRRNFSSVLDTLSLLDRSCQWCSGKVERTGQGRPLNGCFDGTVSSTGPSWTKICLELIEHQGTIQKQPSLHPWRWTWLHSKACRDIYYFPISKSPQRSWFHYFCENFVAECNQLFCLLHHQDKFLNPSGPCAIFGACEFRSWRLIHGK